jgi:hypothetical protein
MMRAVYAVIAGLAVACSSNPKTTTETGATPSDRNIITQAEIAQLPSSSLYDLIQKVRPEFLRSRGTSSFSDTNTEYPVVFVDGRQYGDMASLRTLVSAQISQVRYYDAMAAQAKFGVIKASGVIDVTVKQ